MFLSADNSWRMLIFDGITKQKADIENYFFRKTKKWSRLVQLIKLDKVQFSKSPWADCTFKSHALIV